MRKFTWIILAIFVVAIAMPTVLRATDITYTLDMAVGPGSVMGTITTDGTIGTLSAADILDWNLILNDGTDPSVTLSGPLSGNNSDYLLIGTDLTANATQLLYNFSGTEVTSILLFETSALGLSGPFLCYNNSSGTYACTGITGLSSVSLDTIGGGAHTVFTASTGDDVIGNVAAAPEPNSFALLLAGIGLVLGMRKRKARGLHQAS